MSMHVDAIVTVIYLKLVTKVTNITSTMLRSEKPLSVVFTSFIDWVTSTTSTVTEQTGTVHYPGLMKYLFTSVIDSLSFSVLVAHNGFAFDYPILLAEVERRPRALSFTTFEDHNIHFSDTLPLLKKVLF